MADALVDFVIQRLAHDGARTNDGEIAVEALAQALVVEPGALEVKSAGGFGGDLDGWMAVLAA